MSIMAILSYIAIALIAIYLGNKIYAIPFITNKKLPAYPYWVATGALIVTASELHSLLFGFIIYVFILFVVYDLLLLVLNKCKKEWVKWLERVYMHGLLILILSVLVSVYGYYNSSDTVVKGYDITIQKQSVGEEQLKIIMLSDTHIGTAIGSEELSSLITRINDLKPDLVCLVGDIVDENTPDALMEEAYKQFGSIKTKYGTYFAIGNHELYTKKSFLEIAKGFKQYGVVPLLDQAYLVKDKFYIAGRLDYDIVRQGGTRKTMEQLLKGVDHDYPVILLDHQPVKFDEAKEAGVDLILCGHTHNGQLYPGNYLILLGNEMGYGYRENGSLNEIVSSGVGTWGFAMRVGSHSEIVEIALSAKGDKNELASNTDYGQKGK